jgi:uncharacterized phage infection (PIP) family protein YhgE
MSNKKISELPYIGSTGFTSVDLVPIVSYYSAVTGTTSHTYISDLLNYGYWTSGSTGVYSVRVNNDTTTDATGGYSVAEGVNTLASGIGSHSEGGATIASGIWSHAEGRSTIASGNTSHAEGETTIASGSVSHAEGNGTIASGSYSHAEGQITIASGDFSHSEGRSTTASGDYSHSGGYQTTASGDTSFVHSKNSFANGDRSVVIGGQNITGNTADTVYVPKFVIYTEYEPTSSADTAGEPGSITWSSNTDALYYKTANGWFILTGTTF